MPVSASRVPDPVHSECCCFSLTYLLPAMVLRETQEHAPPVQLAVGAERRTEGAEAPSPGV